jgi:hypothetical protein
MSMNLRHAATLALVYWILLLDTSPDRHGFNEWAGNFSTKRKCELALSREQTHWYDMNPNQPDEAKPDFHVHGKDAYWVRGLRGFCESSDFGTPSGPVWYVLVPPERCADRTRNDIDICDKLPNSEAPLSQWFRTWPSYRTAEECEKVVDMQRRTHMANATDRRLEEAEVAAVRCIGSDVLKGK